VKIRRFVARDMRTALTQIKEELGPDAVIMSNKKIPEGVELMAAVDYGQQTSTQAPAQEPQEPMLNAVKTDEAVAEDVVQLSAEPKTVAPTQNAESKKPADSLQALLDRKVQLNAMNKPASPATRPQVNQTSTANNISSSIEEQFKSFTERLEQGAPAPSSFDDDDGFESQNFESLDTDTFTSADTMATPQATSSHESAEIQSLKQEMASIRQLLEHQVSGLMWQDMAQRDPMRALLTNKLMDIGFSEQMADQISGYVPAGLPESQAWNQALSLVTNQLNTTQNDIIKRGGVVAVVGPTGVGKTTTVAKLAARFAQVHGADSVALISTDTYRIGGYQQLETYGRIIGCQVKLAKDSETLEQLLGQLTNKKLVLIDTAGMGQRDMRLAEHLSTLVSNSRYRIRNYLVLAANTQVNVMQENVDRFKKIPLSGCIFTKLDESLSIGEIISTSIQNGLPIGYLTDGQRVPEDIKVANAEKLVSLADKMAKKFSIKNSMTMRGMVGSSQAVS